MAHFMDKEYLKLGEQMKSTQYRVLRRGIEGLSELDPDEETVQEVRVAKHYKKRTMQKDAIELQEIKNQQNMYLLKAVE